MGRKSESGTPIEAVYEPKDVQDLDPAADLGEPGAFPFTRGIYPTMYVTRPWTMRQYAGFSTAADSNRRYHQLIEAGHYIYPPQPSLRLVADTFAYCQTEIPRWNTISISGYHMAEAGATPVQEIAFTLANAREYVRTAIASGLAVDDFAPRLSFFFVARTTLLEEVAKFRAARRLWAYIIRAEFRSQDPRPAMLRFHTQTAGVQLTAQQPEVNLARVTLQALAAVLGGTQSLHTNSYDEAIALPTQRAATLALRTQQVLAFETDLTATVDPLAGSYALEAMARDIE